MEILSSHVVVRWLCWFSLLQQIVDLDFKAKNNKSPEDKAFHLVACGYLAYAHGLPNLHEIRI